MSYLKLIANPADDEHSAGRSRCRSADSAKRRSEQLSLAAREAGISHARGRAPGPAPAIRPAARPRSPDFAASIAVLSADRRQRRRWTSCCAKSWKAFGTTSFCARKARSRPTGSRTCASSSPARRSSVADEEGESASPRSIISSEGDAGRGAGQARPRRRRGHADDAAQREGARVSRSCSSRASRTASFRWRERTTIPRCWRRSAGSSTSASRAPSESSSDPREGAPAERRVHGLQGVELSPGDSRGDARAAQGPSGPQLRPVSFMHSLGGGSQWGNSRARGSIIRRARVGSTTRAPFRRARRSGGRGSR